MSNKLGCLGTPRKRRRISLIEEDDDANTSGSGMVGGMTSRPDFALALARAVPAAEVPHTDQEANISTISADTKVAEQTVAPFLAQHIPAQDTLPEASDESHKVIPTKSDNSKKDYCYRHRPGLNCRRQIDEPSMDQLQWVR